VVPKQYQPSNYFKASIEDDDGGHSWSQTRRPPTAAPDAPLPLPCCVRGPTSSDQKQTPQLSPPPLLAAAAILACFLVVGLVGAGGKCIRLQQRTGRLQQQQAATKCSCIKSAQPQPQQQPSQPSQPQQPHHQQQQPWQQQPWQQQQQPWQQQQQPWQRSVLADSF
jgi:hypothetical protein